MRNEGTIQQASDQSGSILASTNKTPSAGSQEEQPPLRVVLTGILKASRKPLFGSELARQALAAGYHSNSKNFTNTVTALLTNLDTVEHIPDKGYRLKKA